jgi:general secretion pathway protein K
VVRGGARSDRGLGQLQQLLATLQLNANLANEWLDWIDRGQERTASGAEDADYPRYRTADRPESDISALRLLRSMRPEDYAKLAPHVALLPKQLPSPQGELVDVVAPVNVNTADGAVLRAILGEAAATQVLARQKSGGYKNIAELQGGAGDLVDVKSGFFEIQVTVNYDNRWQRLRTIVRRDSQSGATTVLSRARIPLSDDSEDRSEQP